MLARCTRIWWVRPVPMRTSRNVNPGNRCKTRYSLQAARPFAQPGGHARAVPRIPRYGLLDAPALGLYLAVNQRQVSLLHLPPRKERR